MRRTSLVSVLVMLGLTLVVILPAGAQTGTGTGASPTALPAEGGGLLGAGQSLRLSQLLGYPVRFVGGREAGRLDNLAVDLNTGEVACAFVAPRFPLIEAEKLYPVPITSLRYNSRDARFELDGDARALQRAPRLDRYRSQDVSLAGVCAAAQTFWEREAVRALVTATRAAPAIRTGTPVAPATATAPAATRFAAEATATVTPAATTAAPETRVPATTLAPAATAAAATPPATRLPGATRPLTRVTATPRVTQQPESARAPAGNLVLVRATALGGFELLDRNGGAVLGNLQDLMVDLESGRVTYAVFALRAAAGVTVPRPGAAATRVPPVLIPFLSPNATPQTAATPAPTRAAGIATAVTMTLPSTATETPGAATRAPATLTPGATVVSPAATSQAASRLIPIPWGLLRFRLAGRSATLAVDGMVLEKAPSFLPENWPDTLRAAWDAALKAFWATAGERAVSHEDIGPPWRVPVRLTDFRIEMVSHLMPGPVQFEITNDGDLPHSFHISGGGVDEGLGYDLEPGESAVFSIELAAGSYMVYCPVGRHAQRGMTASLTVSMMPLEGTATPRAGTATAAPLATAPPITRAAPALTPLPRGTLAVPSPTATRAVPTRDNSF